MTWSRLFLTVPVALTLCSAFPASAQGQDDSVSTYLAEIREPALRRANLDALYRSALDSLSQGRYAVAESDFRHLYELEPQSARGLNGVAKVYLAQDRKEDAVLLIRSELERKPARLDLLFALVETAQAASEFDLAIAELMKVLQRPDAGSAVRREVYLKLGDVYTLKTDFESAVAALRLAKELMPEDPRAGTALARALDASGQKVEAAGLYREMCGVDPTDGDALIGRASELSNFGGDQELALSCARLAKELLPESPKVDEVLGLICIRSGMPQDAIGIFENLIANRADSPTYHQYLGMALLQKGEMPRALSELNEALKHQPAGQERERILRMISTLNAGRQ